MYGVGERHTRMRTSLRRHLQASLHYGEHVYGGVDDLFSREESSNRVFSFSGLGREVCFGRAPVFAGGPAATATTGSGIFPTCGAWENGGRTHCGGCSGCIGAPPAATVSAPCGSVFLDTDAGRTPGAPE